MKITKESRNLALSMIIGDGYLNRKGFISIRHGKNQKEYLEWKDKLLNKHGITTTGVYKINNNGYEGYELRTHIHRFLKLYRRVLYKHGKNIANRKLLNKLTPLGIAIWYMDDGSLSNQKRNGKVHRSLLTISTCISKEENQIIIDYFKQTWGIKFGQRKMKNSYALVCSTKEARKFIELVRPYVEQVECMRYKLNVKS